MELGPRMRAEFMRARRRFAQLPRGSRPVVVSPMTREDVFPRSDPSNAPVWADETQQLDALREDVHKAVTEAGQPCGALCDDIAEHLIECGWRHPELINR